MSKRHTVEIRGMSDPRKGPGGGESADDPRQHVDGDILDRLAEAQKSAGVDLGSAADDLNDILEEQKRQTDALDLFVKNTEEAFNNRNPTRGLPPGRQDPDVDPFTGGRSTGPDGDLLRGAFEDASESLKALSHESFDLHKDLNDLADSTFGPKQELSALGKLFQRFGFDVQATAEGVSVLSKEQASMGRKFVTIGQASGALGRNFSQTSSAAMNLLTRMGPLAATSLAAGAALAGFVISTKMAWRALEGVSDRLEKFSPEIINANIQKEIQQLQDEIKFARESGSDIGESLGVRNELVEELREFKRNVFQAFLPMITGILRVAEKIMEVLNILLTPVFLLVEIVGEIFKWITSWIPNFDETNKQGKKILEDIEKNTRKPDDIGSSDIAEEFKMAFFEDAAFSFDEVGARDRNKKAKKREKKDKDLGIRAARGIRDRVGFDEIK